MVKLAGLQRPVTANHPVIGSTTSNIEGYKITRHFTVVKGVNVCSLTVGKSMIDNFKAAISGKIETYTLACEQARTDAYQQMLGQAIKLGANAVIGIRYDSTEIAVGTHAVQCYGTAVLAEKIA